MTADLVYVVAGASLLLAIVLPALLDRWAVSAPMVLVAVGIVIGLTPLPDGMPLDPQENRAAIEHVTELAVLVALMGVGLAIDRPLELRNRASWRRWNPTWRLLGIGMPLTIAAVALLAWSVGVAPAAALLLGAVLAPTDLVLACDVQVAGPQTGVDDVDAVDEDDELRFTLTSEAGLNDGLAFPFVFAAILLATQGAVSGWAWEWIGFHLVAKVLLGVLAGIVVGRVLGRLGAAADHQQQTDRQQHGTHRGSAHPAPNRHACEVSSRFAVRTPSARSATTARSPLRSSGRPASSASSSVRTSAEPTTAASAYPTISAA